MNYPFKSQVSWEDFMWFFWTAQVTLCSYPHILSDLFVFSFIICSVPPVMFQNILGLTWLWPWVYQSNLWLYLLVNITGKDRREKQSQLTLNFCLSVSGHVSLEVWVCLCVYLCERENSITCAFNLTALW